MNGPDESKPSNAPDASGKTFADKVFGFNPFPTHDARREQWEANARDAMEEIYRLLAAARKTTPAEEATSEEFLAHSVELYGDYFDIIAKRFLIFTVNGGDSIAVYERCLTAIIEHLKKKVADRGLFGFSKRYVVSELEIRLKQRLAHWMANALRFSCESTETRAVGGNDTTEAASVAENSGMRDRKQGGRPRKDKERDEVRKMKAAGKSWKDITAKMNEKFEQDKTSEAYRALLRTSPGKNVQN